MSLASTCGSHAGRSAGVAGWRLVIWSGKGSGLFGPRGLSSVGVVWGPAWRLVWGVRNLVEVWGPVVLRVGNSVGKMGPWLH